mmetsp:Transcript_445/g.535  ORF Transcript_445/g.535 Transcript_445/m.535 type:complete len:285 (-) Transcript_445:1046-1900(-)
MSNELIQWLSEELDSLTGIKGSLGYLVILLCAMLGNFAFDKLTHHPKPPVNTEEDEEEEEEPPRNFTLEQLKKFDGKEDRPVYLSLKGTVFDVSRGKQFYGPGGPYEVFAGRECGVALAKMSFDEKHLDDIKGCEDLNFGEKDSLDGWIDQFTHYKCYPVKGKLVLKENLPSPDRVLTKEELKEHNGQQADIPDGYATAPIYVGLANKVFDCSFGGVTFYGPNGAYERFAGVDASRALAKMSFDPKDVENPSIDDLEEKQLKVLADWAKTFETKKGYPIVGKLS